MEASWPCVEYHFSSHCQTTVHHAAESANKQCKQLQEVVVIHRNGYIAYEFGCERVNSWPNPPRLRGALWLGGCLRLQKRSRTVAYGRQEPKLCFIYCVPGLCMLSACAWASGAAVARCSSPAAPGTAACTRTAGAAVSYASHCGRTYTTPCTPVAPHSPGKCTRTP